MIVRLIGLRGFEMGNKTVRVADLLERINHNLNNDRLTQEAKSVLCTVIETVLHDSGNYEGFTCLEGGEYNRFYLLNKDISLEVQEYANIRKKDRDNLR